MTEKNAKIFYRILIGTAIFWVLLFIYDIIGPWIRSTLHSAESGYISGHGGGSILLGVPFCLLVLLVSFIILWIKSKHDKNGDNHDEHPQ